MKTKISIGFGVIVGAALFALAFRNVDFPKLFSIFLTVNLWYLIPLVISISVEMIFRSMRWKILLDASKPVRFWDTFRLETAGLALSNVLPLRLGEIVRGFFGAGLFAMPLFTVFAAIFAERVLDAIALFALFSLAVHFGGVNAGFLNDGGTMIFMLFGMLLALVFLVLAGDIATKKQFAGFFARFPVARSAMERLALGAAAFKTVKGAVSVISLALGQWILDALNFYIVALAFGIADVLSAAKCVALLMGAVLAASVPGMPGYFGNFEFAVAKIAAVWGINREVGLAYAFFIHAVGYLLVTTVGLIFVYQMGQSLGEIWKRFGAKKHEQP